MSSPVEAPLRPYKLKLIETAIPLEDINRESAKEKSIRHGHPSTLHLWWARRPLAACRAVLFAQLVDDPSEHPDRFPTEAEQEVERKRLHGIISELVKWENIHDQQLLAEAIREIRKSCGGDPPPILDPFVGGGSIPLEAQRLGLEAYASDLNPVAVLITKALIEIPPKWAGRPPTFPGAAESMQSWPGVTGLAEDVHRYGKWMRDEVQKRIGHLYPKTKISGIDSTVIAWIWARTVTCPNPACGGTMPLVRSFWLSKKKGKERYVRPVPEGKRVRFEIRGPQGVPREGTVSRTGAVCLLCGVPVPLSYVRTEGRANRLSTQLMAIAAEGKRRRYYLPPEANHEKTANVPRPDDVPEAELPEQALGFRVQGYGMRIWADLFTNRQLTALTTFSDLVREGRARILADGAEPDYADAVTTYLALIVSRAADRNSTICTWDSSQKMESLRNTFARQAIPMTWDFGEGNVLGAGSGNFAESVDWVSSALRKLPENARGAVTQADARAASYDGRLIVATDPPYYDNIGYADLSDFFYVWLRRSLFDIHQELMRTILTPKDDEIVANPFRHGGREEAKLFFEERFETVFARISEGTPKGYPISFFYAYKQAETDGGGNYASTGWETLLDAMLKTGWIVTATWPIHTELGNRPRNRESNALTSSIVLVCRPRTETAGVTDRRGLIAALREEMPAALHKLEQGGVAPVDLRQAAIGPGMAVFSRYARVNEPDGSPMQVRTALGLINQVLDERLSQLEGDVSADTRWCIDWFKVHGFDAGPFGEAETLSKGTDTGIGVLDRAGILRGRAGKVTLLSVRDIPEEYNPARDDRISEWKICLHLAKRLKDRGSDPAARLMATARDRVDLDAVLELAYLLYSIADRKGWAETAQLFNGLGTSWSHLEGESRKLALARPSPVQDQLSLQTRII
jgi:putative DNA methylase